MCDAKSQEQHANYYGGDVIGDVDARFVSQSDGPALAHPPQDTINRRNSGWWLDKIKTPKVDAEHNMGIWRSRKACRKAKKNRDVG